MRALPKSVDERCSWEEWRWMKMGGQDHVLCKMEVLVITQSQTVQLSSNWPLPTFDS